MWLWKESKICNLCIKKNWCVDSHVDLILICKGEKKHYVLIKDFNTFMYDHTLHRGRKHFCRYCLQAFGTVEKLKCHIKDCFKINGIKKQLRCLRRVNILNSKIFEEK